MATKAKPRRWRTPNLISFGSNLQAHVDRMSFDFDRIEAVLVNQRRKGGEMEAPPPSWRASVELSIRNNAWYLLMEIEIEGQPTVPERRAALNKVRDHARELNRALWDLDDASSRDLVAALSNPNGANHWVPAAR